MVPNPRHLVSRLNTHRLGIRDLAVELLVLTFSLLQGQELARCIRVCRYFADLIQSEACLRYKIELAQNGMVDGVSSMLPVSERQKRLRQYSLNFRNGIFDHETPDAHPEYRQRFRNLEWNYSTHAAGSGSALYCAFVGWQSFISVFNHGSAKAGIQSQRWLTPVGIPGDRTRWVKSWAIDRAQDLLVTVEQIKAGVNSRRFTEVRFRSLSGSKTTQTDHPAAAQVCIQLFPPHDSDPVLEIDVLSLKIEGYYVIWVLCTVGDESQPGNHLVEVFNWRSAQVVSRIDFGTSPVNVVPWGDSHVLVQPTDSESPRRLEIYSLTPSSPNQPLRTLQLPEPTLNPGETVVFHPIQTSSDPSPPEGHFHADPSQSMIILSYDIRRSNRDEYTSHLLIPYSTLRAQIDSDRATAIEVESPNPDSDSPPPAVVPWQEWGPQGCLQLRVRPERGQARQIALIPSGSRMPVVASDGPFASVYMFDTNPLAARYARLARHAQDGDSGSGSEGMKASAIVEDVEAALPGVVDPECAEIPYVVHRFRLPYVPWEYPIRAVRMSMTGFTVTYKGTDLREIEKTWTV